MATGTMTDNRPDIPPRASRLLSIDLARGAAVMLMIAAHAAHAFLADSWKENEIWYAVNILFGFVAPIFLFLSGVTLWPALLRRMSGRHGSDSFDSPIPRNPEPGNGKPRSNAVETHNSGSGIGSLARRYLMVLLLGYWLQTPVISLRQLLYNQRPDELARLFDSNVLQVIAITGLLLLGTAAAFRSLSVARIVAIVLGIAVAIITPWFWSNDLHTSFPLPLRMYVAPQPPATIPLLPYLAYFAFGFAASPLLIRAGERSRSRWMPLAAGGILIAAAFPLASLLAPFPPHGDFWGPGIPHLLFRLGGAVLLMALCLIFSPRSPSRGGWLAYIGRHSLAMYVLHLMLIYGSPMNMGMRYWFEGMFGGTLGPGATAMAIGMILVLCGVAIYLWRDVQERWPGVGIWGKRVWWGVFWGVFLLRP